MEWPTSYVYIVKNSVSSTEPCHCTLNGLIVVLCLTLTAGASRPVMINLFVLADEEFMTLGI